MHENLAPTDKILAIDIGGSHIKSILLDADANHIEERRRTATPKPATKDAVIEIIRQQALETPGFTKAAAGFPGFIKNNVIMTAPNLGTDYWRGVALAADLEKALGVPTMVVNDADFQGAGIVGGSGLEMVITLGTGFGTALLLDGKLLPHLEISQHPITKSKNYDQYIGEAALKKVGEEKWNKRMERVLDTLRTVFNFDHLYISGGNAELLNFNLGDDVTIKTNKDGFAGAVNLWRY